MALTLPFGKKKEQAPQAGAGQKPAGVPVPKSPAPAARPPPPLTPLQESELKIALHKLIIARYINYIENSEGKNIAELKELVKPYDKAITELKIQILDKFHPYVFDQHFLQAAELAVAHVLQIRSVTLPLSYWMDFEDMESLHAGDDIDRAILLCSILRSLDCESAAVVISESKKPFVIYEFGNAAYLVEIEHCTCAQASSRAAALGRINERLLYSFNDKEYQDLEERANG
jgi:hypothetical protein